MSADTSSQYDDYFPGPDLFISDELKFLSCLETWFDSIIEAKRNPKQHF